MNPPKMPVHIGDLLRDTGHLRALRFGSYMLLLFHHWSTGELPDDDEQLSAIARMTPQEWRASKPILEKFFGPGWVHDRILADLAGSHESYEKLSKAGKAGADAKAKKKRRTSIAISDEPSVASPTNNLPLTVNQIDRIGSAGASNFTAGSKALASAFWKTLGFESALQIPPEFAGVDWRAVDWEKAGWTVDLIEVEAKRIGPDKPLSYHEKVFATTFAKRNTPLPVVEIRDAEKLTVTHGTAKSNSLIATIDRKLAALAAEDGADFALPENPLLRISG